MVQSESVVFVVTGTRDALNFIQKATEVVDLEAVVGPLALGVLDEYILLGMSMHYDPEHVGDGAWLAAYRAGRAAAEAHQAETDRSLRQMDPAWEPEPEGERWAPLRNAPGSEGETAFGPAELEAAKAIETAERLLYREFHLRIKTAMGRQAAGEFEEGLTAYERAVLEFYKARFIRLFPDRRDIVAMVFQTGFGAALETIDATPETPASSQPENGGGSSAAA